MALEDVQALASAANCFDCLNESQRKAVDTYLLDQIRQRPPDSGPHDLLSLTHPDTLPAAVLRGHLIVGNATPRWSALAIGAAGTFLGSNGTDPSWTALPGGFTGFADPTALVKLTPTNGLPGTTTAMRSDAAPALDQSITPVWTNLHTFSPPANTLAIWVTGSSLTGANAQSLIDFRGTWDTTGAPVALLMDITRVNSAASAKLIDLRVNAVSRFLVLHTGLTQTTFVDTAVGSSPTALEVYHATTGVPTVNNGVSFDLSMDTDTAERRFGGRYSVDWSNVVDATRTSRMRFILASSGVTTEVFQLSPVDGVTVKNTPLFQLSPFSAGSTTDLRFLELAANGFEYVGFKAPTSILSSTIYVLPAVAPTANRFLRGGAVAANVSALTWEQIGLADLTGLGLTDGQLLIGSTGLAPVAASLTAGANITITPGPGSITIAATMVGGFTGFADPAALVGLTPVNGAGTTAMRSTSAPALDQGIAPTWTAAHTWNPPDNVTPITITGFKLTGSNAQPFVDIAGEWDTLGAPTGIKLNIVRTNTGGNSRFLDFLQSSVSRFTVDISGTTKITLPSLAAVTTEGLVIVNDTAAAAGVQQVSPAIAWDGSGWNGASRTVRWRQYAQPLQDTPEPTVDLVFQYSVAIAPFVTALVLSSKTNSITVGIWQGTPVALGFGGTNKAITAVAGAVVWCDADSFELTAAGISGQVLVSGGAGTPVWQNASAASAHTVLDAVAHTDSVTQAVNRGSLIYGNATPKWDELVIGAAARIIQSDGTDVSWVAISSDATIASGGALTIANDAVTFAKMQNIATATFLGRNTAATGDVEELSVATAKTMLGLTGTNSGDVTLAGTPDYITISGQVITRNKLDPADDLNTFASSVLAALVTDETGTGALMFATSPVITTDITIPNTGLHLLDTNASHDLIITPGSDLLADRTLTIITGDVNRSLTFSADATIGGTNTGDVTLAGTPDYITISGQVITRGLIDLATDVTGTLPATNGGTGQAVYAVGDLLYASTTTALSRLADVATGNALISGGVGVAPLWGKIGLTTHVSGLLPVANGGTNAGAFTDGSIVFAGASGTYTQDNARLFWNRTLFKMGIGTNAPNEQLELTGNFRIPATTATTGQIKMGASLFAHAYGTNSLFVGVNAGNLTSTGSGLWHNTGVGWNTLPAVTTGWGNTACGAQSMPVLTEGLQNTGFGLSTLFSLTTGSFCNAMGSGALQNCTTGYANNAMGQAAMQNVTTGNNNCGVGGSAGKALTTATYCTFIGQDSGNTDLINATTPTLNYACAIGAFAQVQQDNCIVLGGSVDPYRVRLAISRTTATAWLHLPAGTNTAGGAPIKFTPSVSGLLTTPEVGAFEVLEEDVYITLPGPLRKRFVLADPPGGLSLASIPFADADGRLTEDGGLTWSSGSGTLTATFLESTVVNVGAGATVLNGDGSAFFATNAVNIIPPGRIGVQVSPTAYLHLAAGTTAASTAPLKFNSGPLMTTAEAGAVEFLTDQWYGTITTGAARKRFLMAEPSAGLTSGRVPYATTNGRLTDSSALLFDGSLLTVPQLYATNVVIFDNRFTEYNNIAVEGFGVAAIVDDVALTNQGADIASTNFTNAAVAGTYRVGYYLVCTTAVAATGTISFAVSFNDGVAVRTLTGTGVLMTSTNKASTFTNADINGSLIKLGSGSIAYSVTVTGVYLTAKYSLFVSLERLS